MYRGLNPVSSFVFWSSETSALKCATKLYQVSQARAAVHLAELHHSLRIYKGRGTYVPLKPLCAGEPNGNGGTDGSPTPPPSGEPPAPAHTRTIRHDVHNISKVAQVQKERITIQPKKNSNRISISQQPSHSSGYARVYPFRYTPSDEKTGKREMSGIRGNE